MNGIKDSSTENFSTIIGNNKKFIIPRFQRDYSWDTPQWDDLWMDIEQVLIKAEEDHYMGYLVLQTSDDKQYHIIDGQQRFTTIMILILAAIKNLKSFVLSHEEEDENKRRIDTLTKLYIGNEDPVSLDYDNILVLNRNNDSFYRDYIVKLDTTRTRNLKASEKLMRNCLEFFTNKLRGKFHTGREYAAYVQMVVEKLYFTKIEVTDELNAFRVFETLNARGVQLSSSDLLKNYLFSLVDNKAHVSRIETLENKWARLNDIIRAEKLPEFLRYYWNSTHKTIRSSEVFKTIRSAILTEEQVFALVNDMIKYSDVYMALGNKDDELWHDYPEIRKYVQLLNVFRVKQPYSALMSAWINLEEKEFLRVLKHIVVICFRYNVICDKNPNDMDTPFNLLSIYIHDNHTADLSLLDKIYVEDDSFVRAFEEKSFPYNTRNVKVVRYILGKIDKFKGSNREVLPDEEDASIEHILPQDFDETWDIDEALGNKLVDRLGNMCLLEKTLNRDLQNVSYKIKIETYAKSSFKSANDLPSSYEEWTDSSVINRQKEMAKIAKSIWKK